MNEKNEIAPQFGSEWVRTEIALCGLSRLAGEQKRVSREMILCGIIAAGFLFVAVFRLLS